MSLSPIRNVVALLGVMVIANAESYGTDIILKSPATCNAAYVTLGDVADIRGASTDEAERLRGVRLVPAPAAGATAVLRVREIQELLSLRGTDLVPLRFLGESRVQVTRPTSDKAAGQPTARGAAQENAFVVVVRSLRPGDRIAPEDVVLKSLPTPRKQLVAPVRDPADAVGWTVVRPVAAGDVLDSTMLRRPTLVQRNRLVKVVARVGGVAVTTQGRAMDDGALDDVISVEMLDDRTKRLSVRVVGLDEVEVFAGGAVLTPRPSRAAHAPAAASGR